MPKRGAAALALTAFALALLLNFRTPDDGPAVAAAGSGGAGSTGSKGSTGSTASGSGTSGSSGSTGSTGSTGSSGSTGSGTDSSSSTGSTGSTGSAGTTSQGTTTVDGPVVDTRYGPVQVEVTVANGQLTAVTALQLPDEDRRSASISSRAEPILQSEALSAQSAAIDGVSGATYTSDGYEQSLQAALDSAGL
jgi:uncharacterized protein with FMN-binding domain